MKLFSLLRVGDEGFESQYFEILKTRWYDCLERGDVYCADIACSKTIQNLEDARITSKGLYCPQCYENFVQRLLSRDYFNGKDELMNIEFHLRVLRVLG